jgi:F-type H+-transporting ATPase subunit delta
MPLVERRYAEALVNISVQSSDIDVYQQEFQTVVTLYKEQPDFKLFLLNPEIRIEEKKEIVKKLFGNSLKKDMVNFLMLLLDKGRIKFLSGIFDEFTRLADKKKNVLNMTIISASPVDEKQINEIKQKYMKLYNSSAVKLNIEIDNKQIGGIKVKIGDKVVDGTVKGRLTGLKDLLLK